MRNWLRQEVGRAPLLYAVLGVVLLCFATYANSLENGFHYDDSHHVAGNPYLRDLGRVPEYFQRADRFSALPGHDMYRPVLLTTFAWNYHTGGLRPLHWRLTAIALHSLCAVGVLLTFRLLLERSGDRRSPTALIGGLGAASFFAVHPVFSETVNYASARSSLLAALFLIWALWLHLRSERAGTVLGRAWGLFGSVVLFSLGLLSKEIAIVYPALLASLALVGQARWRGALPAFCAAFVYMAVRKVVLGTAAIDFAAHEAGVATADAGSGGARPILWNLYTQARVLVSYLLLMVNPTGLTVDHAVRVSRTPFEPGVLAGALIALAMVWGGWRLRRRRPVIALGLWWFLLALAPTSSVIPLNVVMNEHRLYLPGIGLALAFGGVVCALAETRWRPWLRWAPIAGALLVALTVRRNVEWRDSKALWGSAVRVDPGSVFAWNGIGVARRLEGDFEGAVRAFTRGLEVDPESWSLLFNLGGTCLNEGRRLADPALLEKARAWYERSLEVRPGSERSEWYLAEVHLEAGRREEALRSFRLLALRSPVLYEMSRHALARIAMDDGRLDDAAARYGEALQQGRDRIAARLGLAEVERRRGSTPTAHRAAEAARAEDPQDFRPYRFLARLHAGTSRAVQYLFEAQQRGYRPSIDDRTRVLGLGGA